MRCEFKILDGGATLACQEEAMVTQSVTTDRVLDGYQPPALLVEVHHWCWEHAPA